MVGQDGADGCSRRHGNGDPRSLTHAERVQALKNAKTLKEMLLRLKAEDDATLAQRRAAKAGRGCGAN